jgi:restriction endonuclease S subunit
MALTNLSEYLRDLEIKIKSLAKKVEEIKEKKEGTEKEYAFKKDFVQKDVEKTVADQQVEGLGIGLPQVNLDDLKVDDSLIEQTLRSMYKLEN